MQTVALEGNQHANVPSVPSRTIPRLTASLGATPAAVPDAPLVIWARHHPINTIPPRDPDDDDDNDDDEKDDEEVERDPAVIREPDKDE